MATLAIAQLVLLFFIFFPQVVLCKFNTVSFSAIEQCGSFNVSFNGGTLPALPLTLTIVPFNSSPIFVPIPRDAWNEKSQSGAVVTQLPLPAGSSFVASLDDATGKATGLVSDIIIIGTSSNSSCLGSQTAAPEAPLFAVETPLSQCEPFAVSFNTSVITRTPFVRAFIPKGFSFLVNVTGDPSMGLASYTMSAPQGSQVAFLITDGLGHQETTAVMSVSGNSTSSDACINFSDALASTQVTSTTQKSGLSQGAIVAIGISSGSVVGGIAILMALYLYRDRRKRYNKRLAGLEAAAGRASPQLKQLMLSTSLPPSPASTDSPKSLSRTKLTKAPSPTSRYLNPPYVNSYEPKSPEFIQYPHQEHNPPLTWMPLNPNTTAIYGNHWPPLPAGSTGSLAREPSVMSGRTYEERRPSVQTLRSLDIEKILDAAQRNQESDSVTLQSQAYSLSQGHGAVPVSTLLRWSLPLPLPRSLVRREQW
ncbi:hypothetical protein JAAARDRAFT_467733 [Jaapia argillacea MUCL 33604]|uniref:Dystroglycan-type cadherin-like domain-containing protein n=1 Tax=Jaapia argillacea MUCL 33604 TaxID=933084 RepID=A0A067Q6J0_9AGAM|nr:hypothetical protein JAAARDRAFT_467733 [Jaapia argillacea MUCL 33604]